MLSKSVMSHIEEIFALSKQVTKFPYILIQPDKAWDQHINQMQINSMMQCSKMISDHAF